MTAPAVVCIGHATLDAIVRVDHLPREDERVPASAGVLAGGGPAATAAVALARLGVPVAFAGRVGNDAAGRWIRDGLEAESVDVEALALVPGTSPFTVALVDAGGGRALVPAPTDLAPLVLDAATVDRCRSAGWVHVDHVGFAVVAALRAAGVTASVSLDGGNPIPDLSLADVDLYAPTASALFARYPGTPLEVALRAALDEGPRLVVATLGSDGAAAAERTADGSVAIHRVTGVATDVVSTLGAGDAFHGGLLAGLLDGRRTDTAVGWANAVGAAACRALDGRSTLPTRAELMRTLGSSPKEAIACATA